VLEAIFSFLIEVIAFQLGRLYLRILTFGRVNPDLNSRNQLLVSLFGGVTTFAIIVGIGIWAHN
jgi:hypothetical protein